MGKVALTSGVYIDEEAIRFNVIRLTNQLYKLLPIREQHKDWEEPLRSLIEQLSGMKKLLKGQDKTFFSILCKLEGLSDLKQEQDMALYRKIIFECLRLLNEMSNNGTFR